MAQMKNPLLNFRRETLVDRLVQLLQESIYSGKYPPQMMISEAGVSKEFGVSRVPAREALQRLEEMNLIRKNHLRREIVKLSLEEFAQIYELKNVVEAFGAMKGSLTASPQEIEASTAGAPACGSMATHTTASTMKKTAPACCAIRAVTPRTASARTRASIRS